MYAEATGLQVVEDLNGFAYILGNFQHSGEEDQIKSATTAGKALENSVLPVVSTKWDNRKKSAIGYIGTENGALPGLK